MDAEIRRLLEALPRHVLADPSEHGYDDFWVKWSDVAALIAASPQRNPDDFCAQKFYDLISWLFSESPTGRIDLGATQEYHDAMQAVAALRAELRNSEMVTHDESWWHRSRKSSSPSPQDGEDA